MCYHRIEEDNVMCYFRTENVNNLEELVTLKKWKQLPRPSYQTTCNGNDLLFLFSTILKKFHTLHTLFPSPRRVFTI